MDFQLLAVWIIVALAALYVGRSIWKAIRQSGKGCAGGCGRCAAPAPDEKPGRVPLKVNDTVR